MRICPVCGATYQNHQAICEKDGALLVGARRVPRWFWVAAVAALLAAGFASGRILWTKSPGASRSGVSGVPPGLIEETLPQPSSQTTSNGGLKPWDEAAQSQGYTLYNKHRYKEAAPLFEQACEGGSPEGCWFLGIMYGTGQGVQENSSKSRMLLSRACDAGSAIGCYDAALGYTSGKGIGKDYQRAALLYSKACDAGIGPACSKLSDIYAFGAGGIEQNIPRAQELARKACAIKKIPTSACAIPEEQR
jgi:hypothetical protein